MVLAMACIALASSTLLIEQNATPAQRDETNARAEAITLLGESQNQADESSLVNELKGKISELKLQVSTIAKKTELEASEKANAEVERSQKTMAADNTCSQKVANVAQRCAKAVAKANTEVGKYKAMQQLTAKKAAQAEDAELSLRFMAEKLRNTAVANIALSRMVNKKRANKGLDFNCDKLTGKAQINCHKHLAAALLNQAAAANFVAATHHQALNSDADAQRADKAANALDKKAKVMKKEIASELASSP